MEAANDIEGLSRDESEVQFDLKERSDSLVGRIASEIARAISDGVLPPGADLNSVELAARFGTSRTPVREALMLLETEGLVEIPPRRRPRVARMSMTEIEELYAIRSELNGLMISLFVRNADEAQMHEMAQLHEQLKALAAAGRLAEFYETRARMHAYWLRNCGNESLRELLGTWKMRVSVGRLVGNRSEDVGRSLLDHERLVLACVEREAKLAAELMRAMTLYGLRAIKEHHRPGALTGI